MGVCVDPDTAIPGGETLVDGVKLPIPRALSAVLLLLGAWSLLFIIPPEGPTLLILLIIAVCLLVLTPVVCINEIRTVRQSGRRDVLTMASVILLAVILLVSLSIAAAILYSALTFEWP